MAVNNFVDIHDWLIETQKYYAGTSCEVTLLISKIDLDHIVSSWCFFGNKSP